jgi:hypothetical protein
MVDLGLASLEIKSSAFSSSAVLDLLDFPIVRPDS